MTYTLIDEYMVSFFEELNIDLPEQIIPGEVLDGKVRRDADEVYPFFGMKNRGGCYLIFDNYSFNSFAVLNPIYVGRSSDLSHRLRLHWCSPNSLLHEYNKVHIESGALDNIEILHNQEKIIVRPGAPTSFAIWYLAAERDRMLFEHELIYKCEPLMNRA